MAHDVDVGELAEGDPLDAVEKMRASARPLVRPSGRSTCVTSPVTTAFEL